MVGFVAHGANPDEILEDVKLEDRAREISAKVRCMVCQNQSIDDSEAEVARDLRILIREKLVEGKSNQEIYDFLVSKYGEFILLQPRLKSNTLLLWGLPILALFLGIIGLFMFLRKKPQEEKAELSKEEEEALKKLLSE
jgi:cytochrome c-type biogenesis protein CcmH